jgi:hypothetical protein
MSFVMLDPINRQEYESFLAKQVQYGDQEKVALLCQVSPQAIGQQIDPKNKSVYAWLFRAKQFLWALIQINPEAADALYDDLCADYQRWRNRQKPVKRPFAECKPSALTKNIGIQLMEAVEAEQEGQSRAEQRKQFMDIVKAAQDKIADLDARDSGEFPASVFRAERVSR